MNDLQIRNFNRMRTTSNRYVNDSNSFWREELHARVENLPEMFEIISAIIAERIEDNVWGFPVDEQSEPNTLAVFNDITLDYLKLIAGRRVWVYTETNGYWTEEKITEIFSYAFIGALWDIGSDLLISNYPLVADDLKLRSGKVNSSDERQTYHDSVNELSTGDKLNTEEANTRNKIIENNDGASSDTTNGRTTSNTPNIQDTFLSPQDQGVTPSSQSSKVMGRNDFQSPDNMGVEEVSPHGNPSYTTSTTNNFAGDTSTVEEGRTATSKNAHNRADEKDEINSQASKESSANAANNVGGKATNETGIERNETLDIAGILKSFYDLFSEDLLMKIDNRMSPYFLNFKIARYTDHRLNRKEYT